MRMFQWRGGPAASIAVLVMCAIGLFSIASDQFDKFGLVGGLFATAATWAMIPLSFALGGIVAIVMLTVIVNVIGPFVIWAHAVGAKARVPEGIVGLALYMALLAVMGSIGILIH